jgi:hypothetical protein
MTALPRWAWIVLAILAMLVLLFVAWYLLGDVSSVDGSSSATPAS